MSRLRRPGALLFLAIVALSALVPGGLAYAAALIAPQWLLLPELVVVASVLPPAAGAELSLSLRALPPSRAPPFIV
jgi:hypothetical protein